MEAFYNLYKRMIERKNGTKKHLYNQILDAHNKGRLTDMEFTILMNLLEETFGDDPVEE